MQTFEIVVFSILGIAVYAGLSAALYASLPPAMLNFASRHSRYAGLGTPDRLDDSTAGNARVRLASLQGQAA
jgi:hypothetical protein